LVFFTIFLYSFFKRKVKKQKEENEGRYKEKQKNT
jgi:hypothetical protein